MNSHRARLIEKTCLNPDIAEFRFQILDDHIIRLDLAAVMQTVAMGGDVFTLE